MNDSLQLYCSMKVTGFDHRRIYANTYICKLGARLLQSCIRFALGHAACQFAHRAPRSGAVIVMPWHAHRLTHGISPKFSVLGFNQFVLRSTKSVYA